MKTIIIGRGKCRECRVLERIEKSDLDVRLIGWTITPHVRRYTHFKQCGQCFKDYGGKERKKTWRLKRCEECGMPVCETHSFYGKHLGYDYKLTVCFYCYVEYGKQEYGESSIASVNAYPLLPKASIDEAINGLAVMSKAFRDTKIFLVDEIEQTQMSYNAIHNDLLHGVMSSSLVEPSQQQDMLLAPYDYQQDLTKEVQ